MVARGWGGVRGLQGRVTANGVEVSLLGDGSDLNGLWRAQHKGHTLTAPELYKGFECMSCVACELNCSRAIKKKVLGSTRSAQTKALRLWGATPPALLSAWGTGKWSEQERSSVDGPPGDLLAAGKVALWSPYVQAINAATGVRRQG